MTVIILADVVGNKEKAKAEREYWETRLSKLMFRYNMLSEEIRQTEVLIDILKEEE